MWSGWRDSQREGRWSYFFLFVWMRQSHFMVEAEYIFTELLHRHSLTTLQEFSSMRDAEWFKKKCTKEILRCSFKFHPA